MRISDWSSDVCSSDLAGILRISCGAEAPPQPSPGRELSLALRSDRRANLSFELFRRGIGQFLSIDEKGGRSAHADSARIRDVLLHPCHRLGGGHGTRLRDIKPRLFGSSPCRVHRSEEHTSELQSLMRISYAVFCLKKKTKT